MRKALIEIYKATGGKHRNLYAPSCFSFCGAIFCDNIICLKGFYRTSTGPSPREADLVVCLAKMADGKASLLVFILLIVLHLIAFCFAIAAERRRSIEERTREEEKMGLLFWRKNKTPIEVKPKAGEDHKDSESSSLYNGAPMEVPRPEDAAVFEFGTIGESSEKVTLAGYCPVTDNIEPCRWQILNTGDPNAPKFRVVF